jgi:hypothetical protein
LQCSTDGRASLPSCDGMSMFDVLFPALMIAAAVLISWDVLRLWRTWRALQSGLECLSLTPLLGAIRALSPHIARIANTATLPASERLVDLTLDNAASVLWAELQRIDALPGAVREAERVPRALPELRSEKCNSDPYRGAAFMAAYSRAATSVPPQGESPPRDRPQVLRELTALYVVDYIEWAMRHLRYLALFVLTALFLTILMLSSYPFEPESVTKILFFALMGFAIAAVLAVLFQANRNVTLRAMAQSDTGAGGWNARLVINMFLVLGVPALALLSSVFPEVRNFLFSWIAPILQALAKT